MNIDKETKRIVAIVQARMGSTRLPNKMMLHLHGYPVIEWVRSRVRQASLLDAVVFALPDSEQNLVLTDYLRAKDEFVFLGSENDVLDRFYQAASEYNATHIVRICADNPLICPEVIDDLISFFSANECDYAYNHIPLNNRYPDGLGAEIITWQLLARMNNDATTETQRENIMNFIWDNNGVFHIRTFDPFNADVAVPSLKLDLDTYEDYRKLLGKPLNINMNAEQIVALFGDES